MKRQEAVSLLRKILICCNPTDVTFVSLEQPNPKTNVDADGYELHIKWNIDDYAFNVLKGIVTKSNISFKEYDGLLVIYTAKQTLNNLTIII